MASEMASANEADTVDTEAVKTSSCTVVTKSDGVAEGALIYIPESDAVRTFNIPAKRLVHVPVLLTCHHVIPTEESAYGCEVTYGEQNKFKIEVGGIEVIGFISCCGPQNGILGRELHEKTKNKLEGSCPFKLDFTMVFLRPFLSHDVRLQTISTMECEYFDITDLTSQFHKKSLVFFENHDKAPINIDQLEKKVEDIRSDRECYSNCPSGYTLNGFVNMLKVFVNFECSNENLREGNSGTPIWDKTDGTLIAIHTSHDEEEDGNNTGKRWNTLLLWIIMLVTIHRQTIVYPLRILFAVYIMYHTDFDEAIAVCKESVVQKTAEAIIKQLKGDVKTSDDHEKFLTILLTKHEVLLHKEETACCVKNELEIIFWIVGLFDEHHRQCHLILSSSFKELLEKYPDEKRKALERYRERQTELQKYSLITRNIFHIEISLRDSTKFSQKAKHNMSFITTNQLVALMYSLQNEAWTILNQQIENEGSNSGDVTELQENNEKSNNGDGSELEESNEGSNNGDGSEENVNRADNSGTN